MLFRSTIPVTVAVVGGFISRAGAVDNGLAITPQMGCECLGPSGY
jgi:hypothetical protein